MNYPAASGGELNPLCAKERRVARGRLTTDEKLRGAKTPFGGLKRTRLKGMLNLDITLVYQMIGYFVLLALLNILLYKPVIKILRTREERIGGTFKKASVIEKKVDESIAEYESSMKEAAQKGYEENNKLRQIASDEERKMVDAAEVDISKELAAKRREVLGSKRTALADLKEETVSISRIVVEKLLDRRLVIAFVMVVLPLLPALVLASTGGGGAEGGEHAEAAGSSDMLWKVINFAVLALGVYILWIKVIRGLLVKRGDDIKNGIEEAKAAKEAAEKKAEEYREKLSTLEARLAELAQEIRREGEVEKERIMADAATAIVKLKEHASFTLEQEIKKARIEIKREVADLAIKMAADLLTKEIKPEDQDRLVKGYIDDMRLN